MISEGDQYTHVMYTSITEKIVRRLSLKTIYIKNLLDHVSLISSQHFMLNIHHIVSGTTWVNIRQNIFIKFLTPKIV